MKSNFSAIHSPNVLAADSGLVTIDGSRGEVFEYQPAAASLLSLAGIRPGQRVTLTFKQGATAYTFALASYSPQEFENVGDLAPDDAPNSITVYEFIGQASGDVVCTRNGSSALPYLPRVFIMNGQSNAAASCPGTHNYTYLTQFLSSRLKAWSNLGTPGFVNMVDGQANMQSTNADLPGGGQVLSRVASYVVDKTGDTVYTFSLAYTGQGIQYFLPASATPAYYSDGTQHATLNNYNLLLASVTAAGMLESPIEIIWIQGEADAGMAQATYYGYLSTLITAWRTNYPNCRITIVKTLGADVAGVAAAQVQASETFANVLLIDNQDMYGYTAYWGNQGEHYTDCNGYSTVARRIIEAYGGPPANELILTDSLKDIAAWSHIYQYRVQTGFAAGRAQAGAWDDDEATGPVQLVPGTANAPTTIPYDPTFNGFSCVSSNSANTESLHATIQEDGIDWTFFFVFSCPSTAASVIGALFHVFAAGGRFGADVPASGRWAVFYTGLGDITTSGPVPRADEVQTAGIVINGTETEVRWYKNGLLAATAVCSGAANPVNPDFCIFAILSTSQLLTAKVALHASVNAVLTADQMLLAHQAARAEFDLPL